ncbi:MAG: hypothetical protein IIY04_00110 [Oscillospiraceae bacterium]|nr:hypothetical protein [Oscillospiraceae bacterium]
MQTCYNCGKQVEDNVLICPDCGALVKRYTAPPQREEPIEQPSAQTASNSRLYRDKNGKLRIQGGITAFLVIALCSAAYLAVSMFSSIYISHNEALFIELFSAYPEAQPLVELISNLAAAIRSLYGVFLALGILLAAKCVCGIWFLASKMRLAHTVLCVCTGAVAAILIACGGGVYGIWMLADTLVTALLLRNDRPNMR